VGHRPAVVGNEGVERGEREAYARGMEREEEQQQQQYQEQEWMVVWT